MNLLDTIRNNSQPQQEGVTDQTQKLQALLRAKSGKAVTGAAPVQSNLGEQQAVAQTNNTLQNVVAPQAAIQNAGQQAQAAGQEQSRVQQLGAIGQAKQADTQQTQIQTDAALKDLERNKGKIDMQSQASQVNQVAQNLRLQNQQYVDNLQLEGQRSRLDDQNSFRQSLQQSVLGDNQSLLEKQLGDKSVLDANSREFSTKMASMNVDMAYDMFRNELAAEKQRSMYSGLGSLATAGVGAVGTYNQQSAANDAKSNQDAKDLAASEQSNAYSDQAMMEKRK